MAVINQEFVKLLSEFGYKINITDDKVTVRSNFTFTFFFHLAMLLMGFFFLFFGLTVFGIPLVVIPIINLRRMLVKSIVLDLANTTVSYTSGILSTRRIRVFADIDDIMFKAYDRPSYTSASEEGNRDYFADVRILWKNQKETELFYLKRRTPEALAFVGPLVDQLKGLVKKA